MKFYSYFIDFFYLFSPDICPLCHSEKQAPEQSICFFCKNDLPVTNYHIIPESNPIAQQFWGRVEIEGASSLFFFQKGLKTQKILHLLKYKNQPEIGTELGNFYGKILKEAFPFNTVDVIIPVPLHKKKLSRRGYNQSEMIANGISQSLNKPVDINSLQRIEFTETQTKKNRFLRWENVKEKFSLVHPENIKNKHVLLVDDVITTGATLESCMLELRKSEQVRISIVSLAVAKNLI